ncbi:MAG TPA: DUF2946 domain-containing protein [Rhodobacteraceae bacterium]|nr:DUF2946 domain-containing protein [Paracoccaceae bacterium]
MRCLLVVQKLMGVVAVIMLLFGQTLAVSGMQSSSTGGWIEICGLEGVELVQLEGEAPLDGCAHCDFCTVQFSSPATGPSAPTLISPVPVFMQVQFRAVPAEIRSGAEQYWAANRGPPLASEEQMNTDQAYLAAMASPTKWGEI